MIRILHMIGSLNVGGSQAMVMNLYRNIDRNKIQFDFIVDQENCLFFGDEINSLGGRIYRLPKFNGHNYFEVKRAWSVFLKEHKEYKVLHSHVRSYASLYLPVAKKHGLKTIIHSHSTSNGGGLSSLGKKILQFPLRYQADYFFGCSQIAGEWLFGKKVVNSNKYNMLQNAIDLTKYNTLDKRKTIRDELNINDNEIVYGHVGRLHESKNHRFLIDVFNELHKYNVNSKLVIVGEGELRKEIENQIANYKLNDSVILVGQKNNVNEYLQAFDCFLFPSNWEGLPVTVVEAQASGLPCYISNTITKDVVVTELCKQLPIDKGIDNWVKEIKNKEPERINVSDKIKKAGFDIHDTATKLIDFYTRVTNE